MWVRGQNKQLLIDCNKFELSEDETDIIFGNVFDNYYILGTYATKERCLEVLDEIEQSIKDNIQLPSLFSNLTETIAILHENGETAMKNKEFIGLLEKADKSCVYQMPKE